jgi:hypothetical protein
MHEVPISSTGSDGIRRIPGAALDIQHQNRSISSSTEGLLKSRSIRSSLKIVQTCFSRIALNGQQRQGAGRVTAERSGWPSRDDKIIAIFCRPARALNQALLMRHG